MKKIFTLSVICAAAALSLASCQKSDSVFSSNEPVIVPTVRVRATASIEPSTKVIFGERVGNKSKLTWCEEGDRFVVNEFIDGHYLGNVDSVQRVKTGEFYTLSEDATKGEFVYELVDTSFGSRYDYVAIYPATANRTAGKSTQPVGKFCQDFAFGIATPQAPTASTPDTAYCVMAAKVLGKNARANELSFQFKHIAAYGKLTISGLPLAEGETVTNVMFGATTKHNLLGRFAYCPETEEIIYEAGTSSKININPKNIEIKNNTAFTLPFACAPDTLKAGEEITVAITTSEKSVTAAVTLAKDLVLTSGNVTTMSIDVAKYVKETKKLVFDFTEKPGVSGDFDITNKKSWPIAARTIDGDNPLTRIFTLNGVDYEFILSDAIGAVTSQIYWNSNKYLGIMANHRYVGFPAISGYKLVGVSALHSTSSKTRNCGITSQVSEYNGTSFTPDVFVSGGESVNFSTQGQTYSFTLKDTKANTVYYFESINTGIGIGRFTLTYEKVETK